MGEPGCAWPVRYEPLHLAGRVTFPDVTSAIPSDTSPVVLHLPATNDAAALAGSATMTALRSAGIGDMAATEARCVVEALCLDAVQRCHEGPDPDLVIDLTISRVPGAVSIVLHDQGLPIAADRTALNRARQLTAIGFVDHLSLVPVSPDGPTATVTVNLPPAVIHGHLQHEAGTQTEDAGADATFTIRSMVVGDAEAYARLVYRCYGYGYKHGAYDPEEVNHGLASGEHIAAVAEDADGEMIGHVAYQRLRPGGHVIEGGSGMVDPRWRSHGVLNQMGSHLHSSIGSMGIVGILVEPIMVHTATQHMAHGLGFDTGVFLKYASPLRVAGFDEHNGKDRISVLCGYVPLAPAPARTIYPPASVHDYVAGIVAASTLDRRVERPMAPTDHQGTTTLSTHADAFAGLVTIEVHSVSSDLVELVGGTLEDLLASGVAVIHLDLPANDEAAGWFAAGLAELGFVYGALLPECGEDGDTLRLQYLADPEVDMSAWKIELESTADLVHRVIDDLHTWQETQAGARRARLDTWRQTRQRSGDHQPS